MFAARRLASLGEYQDHGRGEVGLNGEEQSTWGMADRVVAAAHTEPVPMMWSNPCRCSGLDWLINRGAKSEPHHFSWIIKLAI